MIGREHIQEDSYVCMYIRMYVYLHIIDTHVCVCVCVCKGGARGDITNRRRNCAPPVSQQELASKCLV